MIKRYQMKHTETIVAIQLTNESFSECLEFVGNDVCEVDREAISITIATPDGDRTVGFLDWITKDGHGNFYYRDCDDFQNTYEEVK